MVYVIACTLYIGVNLCLIRVFYTALRTDNKKVGKYVTKKYGSEPCMSVHLLVYKDYPFVNCLCIFLITF